MIFIEIIKTGRDSFQSYFLAALFCFALGTIGNSCEAVSILKLQEHCHVGEYFVALSPRELLFYGVIENSKDAFIVHLASAPKSAAKNNSDWKSWAGSANCPANVNVILAIQPESGSLLWVYDLQKNNFRRFIDQNLITTLLTLPIKPQLEESRKKKFLDQKHGPSYWSPPVRFEGKIYSDTHLTPWEAKWPVDDSDLSQQKIVIYLATSDPRFLPYIPYLIELGTGGSKQALRTIDSGRGYSPQFPLPKVFTY